MNQQHKTLMPANEWFENWERQTGETAPDMTSLKAFPDLPPLLEGYDGTPVTTLEAWEERKIEIRQLLCHYLLGSFPSEIPALTQVEIVQETKERGATRQVVQLTFDTINRASFTVEVMIPEGEGPHPVFLTQTNHRRWGLLALSRGYVVCVYPGADVDDQSDVFQEAYPECDWALLPRRAWLGSRALDYVLTLSGVDAEKVAITGHSRNGKQSLMAAAFDERITAVISSSSGAGGACPFRLSPESAFQESAEFMTRRFPTWFHPRLRYFTGREHLLPIDSHALLGLIAPRACLLATAYNDGCETSFAVERTYAEAKEVYDFYQHPEALRILWRQGGHSVVEKDVQYYLDWFDQAFGRNQIVFPEHWLHRFDWAGWKANLSIEQETVPFDTHKATDVAGKRARILWGLGEAPPGGIESGRRFIGRKGGAGPAYKQEMMQLDARKPNDVTRVPIAFGEGVPGNLYFRKDVKGKRPVVIWLHPYSYSMGLVGSYLPPPRIFNVLAEQGYVVMAFDHIGFGSRIEAGWDFYKRYPAWSRLGKMVRDVQGSVDLLTAHSPLEENEGDVSLPLIDHDQIYCLGYSLGGMIGLYAGALDERIAGVASFCGFTPMRTDTDRKPTGGIRRFWEWHSLQPRLGLFQGRENEIPYDFDDVISLIAPRPCLIVSPIHDREADHPEVTACVDEARKAWARTGEEHRLTHLSPDDYNRFHSEQHELFLEWLHQVSAGPEE